MQNMQNSDFHERFEEYIRLYQGIQQAQKQREPCVDKCCRIVFIISLFGYFGFGGYFIYQSNQFLQLDAQPLGQFGWTLFGVITLSIGISLLLLLVILRYHPLAGLWATIGLALAALIGLLTFFFQCSITAIPGIVVSVILVSFIICVICYKNKIKQMSLVLHSITILLQERKRILFITLFVLIFAIGFMIFWMISYYYVSYLFWILNTVQMLFWIIYGIYWTFWFYYAIVYIIGAETALWFYNSQKTSVITPIKWLLEGNLGTVTFGAIILIFIKIGDFLSTIFCCGNVCVCLKLKNNHNIILSSITSQNYSVSLKLTGHVFMKNYQMLQLVKVTSYFVLIGGITVSSGISTIIGVSLLMRFEYYQFYQVAVDGAIIFFVSMFFGMLIYSTYMQAISAMFLLHSYQKCKDQLVVRSNKVLPNKNKLQQYIKNNFNFQSQMNNFPNISHDNLRQNNNHQIYDYPQPYQQGIRYSQQLEREMQQNVNVNPMDPF